MLLLWTNSYLLDQFIIGKNYCTYINFFLKFFLSLCRSEFLIHIIFLLSIELLKNFSFWIFLQERNYLSACLRKYLFLFHFEGWFQSIKIFRLLFFSLLQLFLFTFLHGFWWEIWCKSYPCSSIGKTFFSSSFWILLIIFFVFAFAFCSVNMKRFGVDYLAFIQFDIYWGSWLWVLLSIINFEKKLAITTWTISSNFSFIP